MSSNDNYINPRGASLHAVTNEISALDNICLKYISTKKDELGFEHVYYSILNKDFDNAVKDVKEDERRPWFKGKGDYILKVKSKYVKEEHKIDGEATINLAHYDYNNIQGYYVYEIAFK